MLNIEDRLAIGDLYARLYWANDTGDVEGWVTAFLPDGVFSSETWLCKGREMIEAFVRARIAERRKEPFKNGQHLITNLLIEGHSDIARARCYFVYFAQSMESNDWRIRSVGWYDDEIRKVGGTWGFQQRKSCHSMPMLELRS